MDGVMDGNKENGSLVGTWKRDAHCKLDDKMEKNERVEMEEAMSPGLAKRRFSLGTYELRLLPSRWPLSPVKKSGTSPTIDSSYKSRLRCSSVLISSQADNRIDEEDDGRKDEADEDRDKRTFNWANKIVSLSSDGGELSMMSNGLESFVDELEEQESETREGRETRRNTNRRALFTIRENKRNLARQDAEAIMMNEDTDSYASSQQLDSISEKMLTDPFNSIQPDDKLEDKRSTKNAAIPTVRQLIVNDFEIHIEEDIPQPLLGHKELTHSKYNNGDYEVDTILDYDDKINSYLVMWKGWSLTAVSYVVECDINSKELIIKYHKYRAAMNAIEARLKAEKRPQGAHTELIPFRWQDIHCLCSRFVLYNNKIREARFNELLADVDIAPVFIENWHESLRQHSRMAALSQFRFLYKCFMARPLRNRFLALKRKHEKFRCKCTNGAEDCSPLNIQCCTNQLYSASDHFRLSYDITKRLQVPTRLRQGTYELVECSSNCKCGLECPNRITQRGRTVPLVIFFENKEKRWGIRAGEAIKRGQFITEYVGEIVLLSSLPKNANETYQFSLPGEFEIDGKADSLIIDASHYGNEARFINHSCKPNTMPVMVYSEDYGEHYSRVCFFAFRDIEAGEELGFNYYSGRLDDEQDKKGLKCRCHPQCKNYIPEKSRRHDSPNKNSSTSSPPKKRRRIRKSAA